VNRFTASEIATLQSRLNKQLGPEYISTRPGNGGGKVAYLEGNKAIALANEVFGFNGWSSSLGQVQIDYVRQHVGNQVFNTNVCRWTSFRTGRSAWVFR
jgi:DNA recombination protein Rad52